MGHTKGVVYTAERLRGQRCKHGKRLVEPCLPCTDQVLRVIERAEARDKEARRG